MSNNFDRVSLINFLKILSLKKEVAINEVVFVTTADKTEVKAFNIDNKSLIAHGIYKKDLSQLGTFSTSLLDFIKYLEALDDKLQITVSKNKLILNSDNTKISLPLQSAEYVKNVPDESKLKPLYKSLDSGVSVSLSREIMQHIVDKFNIISGEHVFLKVESGKVIFQSKNSKETDIEFILDKTKLKTDFSIYLPKFFIYLLELIIKHTEAESVELKLKENNSCCSLTLDTDDFFFSFIISVLLPTEKQ